ncbi:Aquaporin 1 [Mycena indigotica]|uniref:Aquaporin 1 n=1 Tax=Mycena indigotica TaxID=2126181 RepID=A0A8H6T6W9_9AGAR|nr:Aquaporin 1 [Mycena indigotica]KAF7312015.1 Aquaporin 1 [Mycena indigotica]
MARCTSEASKYLEILFWRDYPSKNAGGDTVTPKHEQTILPPSTLAMLRIRIARSIRNDFLAACLELVGTTLFLLLGLGGIQAANAQVNSNDAGIPKILYVSTCMGFSLVVCAWVFFRITGSLFNPCITVALVLLGIVSPFRGLLYFAAQFGGSVLASLLLVALTGELSVNTNINPQITPTKGVFIEMFITGTLVLAVLFLAAEKHQATAFAPVGIGLTLFSCHLFAVFYTGASMNTARSFGPAVISGFPTPNHWVYWAGPFLGAFVASAFYAFCKYCKYSTLNPHQDTDDVTKSPDNPMAIAQAIIQELDPRRSGLVGQISERLPKLSVSSGSSSVRARSNSTLIPVDEGAALRRPSIV